MKIFLVEAPDSCKTAAMISEPNLPSRTTSCTLQHRKDFFEWFQTLLSL
jgi:hypothetical protein